MSSNALALITARYDGKCRLCKEPITRGESIRYAKTLGAFHPNCVPSGLEIVPEPDRFTLPTPEASPPPIEQWQRLPIDFKPTDYQSRIEGKFPTMSVEAENKAESNSQKLTVAELRKECSARCIGSSGWRVTASKAELIKALLTGIVPFTADSSILETPEAPSGDLAATIAKAIQSHIKVGIGDEASLLTRIETMIDAGIAKRVSQKVELTRPDGTKVEITGAHSMTPVLLTMINEFRGAGFGVCMVGPAGSGKTTAAEKVAEALGMRFAAMSVGPQTTLSHIFGYMDANGHYVRSPARECFENGGVFLFDEIDAGSGNVLTGINAMLSNGICAFPDGMIKKHADFVCLAAGNTYGLGANRVYVGRTQLDGATLDRFAFLEWPVDEILERNVTQNDEWCDFIQAVRKKASDLSIRHIVSPRASIYGARLLKAGLKRQTVLDTVLWKGIAPDDRKKLENPR